MKTFTALVVEYQNDTKYHGCVVSSGNFAQWLDQRFAPSPLPDGARQDTSLASIGFAVKADTEEVTVSAAPAADNSGRVSFVDGEELKKRFETTLKLMSSTEEVVVSAAPAADNSGRVSFLHWIHERLQYVHHENPNMDYMINLKKFADNHANNHLPKEIKDCTILFIECREGHGRLMADNWLDRGCQTCSIDQLKIALKVMIDNFR